MVISRGNVIMCSLVRAIDEYGAKVDWRLAWGKRECVVW
jgi:hypothetical protein